MHEGGGLRADIEAALDEVDDKSEPVVAARAFLARLDEDKRFRDAVRRLMAEKRGKSKPVGGDDNE
jgi:hypothetical protein